MEKKHSSSIRLKAFLKKNVYYIIMAVCLLAIAAMITVTVLMQQKTPTDPIIETPIVETPIEEPTVPIDTPVDPPVTPPVTPPAETPVVLVCPVSNPTIALDYVIDTVVWHETLGHYAVNLGIDYTGNDGDKVMSAYSGTVKSIDYNVLEGYVVTIEHNSKLTTKYSSLNEPTVTVGQAVAKGEKIGTMGSTATNSYLMGPHLHFRLYENNVAINPASYMAQGNK